jgi:error-prone DNA polymerase
MGFYHPFTLVKDAQRTGCRSGRWTSPAATGLCTLEDDDVRLGLRYVHGLRKEAGERIAAVRMDRPFVSLQDFVDRTSSPPRRASDPGRGGALNAFGLHSAAARSGRSRRRPSAGPAVQDEEDFEPGTAENVGDHAEPAAQLPIGESPPPSGSSRGPLAATAEMSLAERLGRDLSGLGLTAGPHPLALYREMLAARGVRRSWTSSARRRPARARRRPRDLPPAPGATAQGLHVPDPRRRDRPRERDRPPPTCSSEITRCSCPRACSRSTASCKPTKASRSEP